MKKYFVLIGVFLSTQAYAATYYMLRHAEKIDDGSQDPVLTLAGQQRARNIANMLSTVGIKKIYATDYQRTQLTAQPLAALLGIEVMSYDPSDLPGFASKLKADDQSAMIVGHSNTTPMLTYLLSNQPVMNLDEVDYDNIFQVVLKDGLRSLQIIKSLPSQANHLLSDLKPTNSRFFNGQLTFNMLLKGQVVGQSIQQFHQHDERYKLSEQTEVKQLNINTNIQTVVEPETLAPLNFSMTGIMDQPVDIQLSWLGTQVTGHSEMDRAPFKAQGKIWVNQKLREKSLERTSTMMLAHLMPVSKSKPLLINWFNGYDADNRLINMTWQGEEQVTVPAGTFRTTKIKYSGGAPSQYYWIDQVEPKVVKIEVIKSPWSYELVAAEIQDKTK